MSAAMDKALMAMSLEDVEEDLPFQMPDLPEFSSAVRNMISLVGRVLYPECQPMKHLLKNMPRKWQKEGRVRGIALTKERFQFIFNSEHDLQEVLDKGVHTFNEWTLAVDRWYEHPPDNYLQVIPMWVQIWNLPINYFTKQAITALGELIGQVTEVAFDPEKPQIQEFVRVKVIFDIARPLRRSKVISLPGGGTAVVRFQYERVQKRCYECQRLTHEKDFCPFLIKQRQDEALARSRGILVEKPLKPLFLKESDPLFGVLREDQVGVDPMTGRLRIAADVLEGMRQFLMVGDASEKVLRVDKVKKSVGEVEKDPLLQKSILRLEPTPLVHLDLNKGKGLVFEYENEGFNLSTSERVISDSNRITHVNSAGSVSSGRMESFVPFSLKESANFLALSQPFQVNPTVFRTGFSEAGSSGIKPKTPKVRRRPNKSTRKAKPKETVGIGVLQNRKVGLTIGTKDKRKAVEEGTSTAKSTKLNPLKAVPMEGLPHV